MSRKVYFRGMTRGKPHPFPPEKNLSRRVCSVATTLLAIREVGCVATCPTLSDAQKIVTRIFTNEKIPKEMTSLGYSVCRFILAWIQNRGEPIKFYSYAIDKTNLN